MHRRSSVAEGFLAAIPVLVLAMGLCSTPRLAARQAPGQTGPSQGAAGHTSIFGAWKLNHELSDRRQALPVPDSGEVGERGGRSGGGPGFGGMGGRSGGGRPDAAQMKQMRDLMQEIMTAPESLVITDKPGQVTFTDADGHVRRYATDGKGEKHQLLAGVVETRTRWKEGRLVIEISPGRGMTLVVSYAVDPDTRQLVVTLETENSRSQGSMRPVRRVYDNLRADR